MPAVFSRHSSRLRGGHGCCLGRPRLRRRIRFDPHITYFKPQGRPMRDLEIVVLSKEEVEAMRLKNLKGLTQTEAAQAMKTSQSTFARILASAYRKVSEALVAGKAISISRDEKI